MRRGRILPAAALIAVLTIGFGAPARAEVKLLVNRNGIRDSFDVGKATVLEKSDRIALKNRKIGKLTNGTTYMATAQGTNKIYIYGKNGKKKKTIKVKQIKWIAHRGFSAAYVENTIDAIEGAARAGAWGVELDLRLSSDGVPYVFHDETLQEKTNGRGAHDLVMPYSKLSRLSYRGFSPAIMRRTALKRIPTFLECVQRCRDLGLDVCVDVHPKYGKKKNSEYKKIAKAGAKVIDACGMKKRTMTVRWGGCGVFRSVLGISRTYNKKDYWMEDRPPF